MTCVQTTRIRRLYDTRIRRLYFLCEYKAFQIFFLMGLEVRGNLEIGNIYKESVEYNMRLDFLYYFEEN